MLMATSMKVSGEMIRLMGKVLTHMPTVPLMLESGSMTSSTEEELKLGQIVLNMMVNITRVKSMVGEPLLLQMEASTSETSR